MGHLYFLMPKIWYFFSFNRWGPDTFAEERNQRKPELFRTKRIHQFGHQQLGTYSAMIERIFSTWKNSVMST